MTRRALKRRKNPFRRSALRAEALEERRMLATFTVTNLNDTGVGSLRDQVDKANLTSGPDTIIFDSSLSGGEIQLESGELLVTESLTINGPGSDQMNLIGSSTERRIFTIDDGVAGNSTINLTGLTLSDGEEQNRGGAILSSEHLNVTDLVVRDGHLRSDWPACFVPAFGGGIYIENANLTISRSHLASNSALCSGAGGAVFITGGQLTVANSTFDNNGAIGRGGGIGALDSDVTIFSSIFTEKSSLYFENSTAHVSHTSLTSYYVSGGWGYPNDFTGSNIRLVSNSSVELDHVLVGRNAVTYPVPPNAIYAGDIFTDDTSSISARYSLISDNYMSGLTESQTSDSHGNLIGSSRGLGFISASVDRYGFPAAKSVLLDAGDPAYSGSAQFDQRGAPFGRVYDSDFDGVARIDIGAIERQPDPNFTSLVVDTVSDVADGNYEPGHLSLREAIALANRNAGIDTITFDATIFGQTITLGRSLPPIIESLNIVGPGADQLTIYGDDGQFSWTVFYLAFFHSGGFVSTTHYEPTGVWDVEVSGLRLTGANSEVGAVRSSQNLTLRNMRIEDNQAATDGGAVFSSGGTLTIIDSSISGNTAARGGGVYAAGGDVIIENSTFSDNHAESAGGALFVDEGTADVVNSTFSANTADDFGGAVFAADVGLAIRHTTITANRADENADGVGTGGGVYVTPAAATTINNSIVALNTGATNVGNDFVGQVQLGHSLLGDATGAFVTDLGGNVLGDHNQPAEPDMRALADNGGPTLTHALNLNSPAINAGDPAAVAGAGGVPLFDQGGGNTRVGHGRVDMGAVEFNSVIPSTIVVNLLADTVDHDQQNQISLREAVALANISPDDNVIEFHPSLAAETFALTASPLLVTDDLTLSGSHDQTTTIDGLGGRQLFIIDDGDASAQIAVEIADLRLRGGEGLDGGAILSSEALILRRLHFIHNEAQQDGGAVASMDGSLSVYDSTLERNAAANDGGALAALGGSLHVERTSILYNSAAAKGGGIYTEAATTVVDSTLAANTAISGGGFSSNAGTVTVSGSTLSSNLADYGGGGHLQGEASILHTTITGNTAGFSSAGGGGGLWAAGADPVLIHTLVADNFDTREVSPELGQAAGTSFLLRNSLVGLDRGASIGDYGGNLIGTGNNIIDPLLAPLSDNGGPTLTHALLEGSPATDAGAIGVAPASDYDQRGAPFARIQDGDRDGQPRIDIGSFERLTLVVDTTIDESDGDFSVGDFSLREAVEQANQTPGSDRIRFDSGLSGQTIGLSLGEIPITESLTISGLGDDQLTIDAAGSSRIFNINDGSASTSIVSISGLTLTGGQSAGGGAIRTVERLTVSNSTLTGNNGTDFGGAIFNYGTALTTVSNSNLSGNVAESGGALLAFFADITIRDSTLTNNTATDGVGGAVMARRDLLVEDSTLSGNVAYGEGGAIYGRYGYVEITGSGLYANSAVAADGGGIYVSDGALHLERSTITGNSAGDDGGAVATNRADLTAYDSLFANNEAGDSGGAMYLYDVSLVRSSTLVGNSAGFAGGAAASRGALHVINSTLSANTAHLFGGALYSNGAASLQHVTVTENTTVGASGRGGGIHIVLGTTALDQTIVAGNSDASGTADNIDNGFNAGTFDVRYSLVGPLGSATINDLGANHLNMIDAGLAPLAESGGALPTHALIPGSPAIDGGDPQFNPQATTPPREFDQRGFGFDRIVDGDSDGTAIVDIGAFERRDLVVDTWVDESDGNLGNGDLSLREAVELANQASFAETIRFDLPGATNSISLALGEITITNSMQIDGGDGELITVDAGGFSRIFRVGTGSSAGIHVELARLTLTGGMAVGTGLDGSGGAILNDRENLILRESLIFNNTANDGGGLAAKLIGPTTTQIVDSTIAYNTSLTIGGGVQISTSGGGMATITNSTVAVNEAGTNGGGLFISGGPFGLPVEIRHTTIAGNSAQNGGGIASAGGSATATLDHALIAENTALPENYSDVSSFTLPFESRYSLIGDATGATITDNGGNQFGDAAAPIDPELEGFEYSPGSTPIIPLRLHSPARNAGDPLALPGANGIPQFDQRGEGFTRVSTGRIDIGAYERSNSAPLVDAGSDQVGVAYLPVQLDGQAVDLDMGPLPVSLSWQVVASPPGSTFTLAGSDTHSVELTADRPGAYVLQLTADDGELQSHDLAIATLFPNEAPIADASLSSMAGIVGEPIQLDGTASSDPESETLAYLWSIADQPAGSTATLADATNAITALNADMPGDYVIQLFVNDGHQFSLPSEITIVVASPIDGDFDNDGDLDGRDIDLLQGNIANGPPDPSTYDLTGDGLVTVADRDAWLVLAGAENLASGNPYLLGDANLDGNVDGQDFIAWNSNKFTSSSAWTKGDFNVDGVIDGPDFIIWNNNKFLSADVPPLRPPTDRPRLTHRYDEFFADLTQSLCPGPPGDFQY